MMNGAVLVAVPEGPVRVGEQLARIGKELAAQGLEVRWASQAEDARAVLQTEAGLAGAVVAWDLPGGVGLGKESGGAAVLRLIERRFKDLPVLLVMSHEMDADRAFEQLP
ncbi:Orn/Lys/Arg decarboxylase N-terminal domain-containing protein, partial [Streptomyces albidoflavus]